MFFLSNKEELRSYTFINNVFFEQIMPYIDDKYLKVYMYIYYIAYNIDKIGIKTNDDIAKSLNIDYNDVLSALDYLDKCNLIRKHYVENSDMDNYSIEILPISNYHKNVEPSYEEEYVYSKNEKLKNMYEQIEDVTKIHLNAYDIKKIDTCIINNDISYDVVVEAFKFVYYNKKSVSVTEALSTLKLWIKDGIYTSKDLDTNLANINERYATYRKILKYFGEYRLPTKPEIKKMDKWIDEYTFSIEVIEKAIDETLKIKSPNFKYLDAILDSWYAKYKELKKHISTTNNNDYISFKTDIISSLEAKDKISDNEDKKLSFLYKHYPIYTVKSAINHISSQRKQKNIDSLFDFITNGIGDDKLQRETVISFGNISIEEMEEILSISNTEYAFKKQSSTNKTYNTNNTNSKNKRQKYANTPTLTGTDLEEAILANNDLDEF